MSTWRNRLLAFWRKYVQGIWQFIEWPAILLFVLIVLGVGYFGLKNYYGSLGQAKSLPDMLYSLLQLFILGSNYVGDSINFELEIVRLLAPLFPFYMIIKLFGNIFQEKIQLFYLRRIVRDHVVICGMNSRALILARDFYGRGYRIVVIDNLNKGMLEKCRDMDAIVLAGSASDPEMLEKAQVRKARYLIAVADSESANAEAAVSAGRLAGEGRGKALTCYVHISDLQLWSLLRGFQLRMARTDTFRVEFINVYNSGARVLLDKYPADMRSIIIVGMGKMGENLAVEAARAWYFDRPKSKPHLVLVDKDASDKASRLLLQYTRMAEACDIVPFPVDILSPKFLQGNVRAELLKAYPGARVYICPGDDVSGVSIALSLLPFIDTSSGPAILCTEQESGLARLVKSEDADATTSLEIFPLLSETYQKEVLLGGINAILARAIHDDYLQKQKDSGAVANPSMVSWDVLPEDLKESNRRSADDIIARLKTIGCDVMPLNDWGARPAEFTAEEVETMSVMEHRRWVKERLLQGYRYAPGPKDLEKKTSPYLVEWDRLPGDIKELDRNVVRGIPGFLVREGFQVYRISGNVRVVVPLPIVT